MAILGRLDGWVEKGGQPVVAGGISSTSTVQLSYPSTTVTIYNAGTLAAATIFSDAASTAKANPFTADANGYWFFWAAPGDYDITFGSPASLTRASMRISAPAANPVSINVKDYGATGLGIVDDGAAITAAAAALTAAGGGTLVFPPGTYLLFNTAGGYIASLTGLTGVNIFGYGATLKISTTNAAILSTGGYGAIFNLTTCKNVKIDGFNVTGPDMSVGFAGGTAKGIDVIQLGTGNENIDIPTLTVQGAQSAVGIVGVIASAATAPNRRIHIGALKVSQSWYGMFGYYGVEGLSVDQLRTDTIYRSFFLHGGIYNVKANVWSKNNYGSDILLEADNGLGIEDVELTYRRGTDTTLQTGGGALMLLGFNDETPSVVRNVRIRADVQFAGAGSTGNGVLKIIKNMTNGTLPDTTDRGHIFENITFSAHIDGVASGLSSDGGALAIYTDFFARWGATLDRWSNIVLQDVQVTTASAISGVTLDSSAAKDQITLRNVIIPTGTVQIGDTGPQVQVSAKAKIIIDGLECSNKFSLLAGPVFPIFHRQANVTTFTIPAVWCLGTVVTVDNGQQGAIATFTLPPATVGMRIRFSNSSASAIAFRIDPNGTEIVRDGATAGAAGKYFELTSFGSQAELACYATGLWQVVAKNGGTTFEP